jgi:hypothetical protein
MADTDVEIRVSLGERVTEEDGDRAKSPPARRNNVKSVLEVIGGNLGLSEASGEPRHPEVILKDLLTEIALVGCADGKLSHG